MRLPHFFLVALASALPVGCDSPPPKERPDVVVTVLLAPSGKGFGDVTITRQTSDFIAFLCKQDGMLVEHHGNYTILRAPRKQNPPIGEN